MYALNIGLVAGLMAGMSTILLAGTTMPVHADDVKTESTRSFRPADKLEDRLSDGFVRKSDADKPRVEQMLSYGQSAFSEGNYGAALKFFEQAAEVGHPLAQWKLGKMYQDGQGVGANQTTALKYFTDVAVNRGDEPPNSLMAPFVAHSLVAVGKYYLNGIKGSDIRKNPHKAMKIFRYAASFYGNAEAQFNLGRMYFEGRGGYLDKKMAARWLKLAALKGHHQSQALLGRMMFMGDGIPARPSEGLMWLTLARERAEGREDDWIRNDQERAFALATENERRSAITGAGKWNNAFVSRR